MTALKLSKDGFGNPQEILKMRTDVVLYMIEYSRFHSELESAFIELNKESK